VQCNKTKQGVNVISQFQIDGNAPQVIIRVFHRVLYKIFPLYPRLAFVLQNSIKKDDPILGLDIVISKEKRQLSTNQQLQIEFTLN